MGRFQRYESIPGRCPELSPFRVVCLKEGLRHFFGEMIFAGFPLLSQNHLSYFSSFLYMNVAAPARNKRIYASIHIPIDGEMIS